MLHPLHDAFVQRRMDVKYGSAPCAVRTEEADTTQTSDGVCIRFLAPPEKEGTCRDVVEYAPRSRAVDARRRHLCDVYRSTGELQDLRDIVSVPPCMMHVVRSGMRHVFAPGPVRIHDMIVALVSTREVGALLFEVVRNTSDLEPRHCTRLVAHMCKTDAVAMEWLACFGI